MKELQEKKLHEVADMTEIISSTFDKYAEVNSQIIAEELNAAGFGNIAVASQLSAREVIVEIYEAFRNYILSPTKTLDVQEVVKYFNDIAAQHGVKIVDED